MNRTVNVSRKTKETDIAASVNLDGNGKYDISTGVGFFDHMLISFCVHGGFDITLKVNGDLHVDVHHSVEDSGIVLGKAFAEALGDKSGIVRFGNAVIPMDESLATATLDISGRPFLLYDCRFTAEKIGDYDTQMTEEFMRAFAFNAGITLHINLQYGSNDHHKCEAMFKALAYALKVAVKRGGGEIMSAKGVL